MLMRSILLIAVSLCSLDAKMFQSIKKENGTFVQKGESRYYCPNCGMNLIKFYKTNHTYKGQQYCSLHCLYEATKGVMPRGAKVSDAKTLKLIKTEDAYYVIGGEIRGTMTRNSKYAFKDIGDAKAFQKKYGGKIVNFEQAYATAGEDFKKDKKIIRIKKEKKLYKSGKKLYKKRCSDISANKYLSIADLKAILKSRCKNVKNDKKLQAIAGYLWDIERKGTVLKENDKIIVPHDAKCPICGMFVHKYPKWAATIELGEKKIYFDGCKDMFKYYIPKKKEIASSKLFVTDYFSGKKIKANLAYFVMGSNVYGPMGNELIPFKSELDANAFRKDHFGIKVLKFLQVVEDKDVMKDLEDL